MTNDDKMNIWACTANCQLSAVIRNRLHRQGMGRVAPWQGLAREVKAGAVSHTNKQNSAPVDSPPLNDRREILPALGTVQRPTGQLLQVWGSHHAALHTPGVSRQQRHVLRSWPNSSGKPGEASACATRSEANTTAISLR